MADLNDFGRMACAFEPIPLISLSLDMRNERVLALEGDFVYGRPIIYYVKNRIEQFGEYLAYRVNGLQEEVSIVDHMSSPTFSYSPIINIDSFPFPIVPKTKTKLRSRFKVTKLRDLTSLVKVCAYKSYDEPPIPLLLFEDPKSKRIILGAAATFSDSDDFYSFYYIHLENIPSSYFIRYTSQRTEPPFFSNKLDEHGCIYLKVVRLALGHPLVSFHE